MEGTEALIGCLQGAGACGKRKSSCNCHGPLGHTERAPEFDAKLPFSISLSCSHILSLTPIPKRTHRQVRAHNRAHTPAPSGQSAAIAARLPPAPPLPPAPRTALASGAAGHSLWGLQGSKQGVPAHCWRAAVHVQASRGAGALPSIWLGSGNAYACNTCADSVPQQAPRNVHHHHSKASAARMSGGFGHLTRSTACSHKPVDKWLHSVPCAHTLAVPCALRMHPPCWNTSCSKWSTSRVVMKARMLRTLSRLAADMMLLRPRIAACYERGRGLQDREWQAWMWMRWAWIAACCERGRGCRTGYGRCGCGCNGHGVHGIAGVDVHAMGMYCGDACH